MINLRELEAKIVESIKEGHELHHIREQIQKKPRFFRNTITRMVELGILEKIEKGMYAVRVEQYSVKPDSEVIEERKRKTKNILSNNVPNVNDKIISIIRENYNTMYRSAILKLLHKAGFQMTKFELNLIIMNDDNLTGSSLDADQVIA